MAVTKAQIVVWGLIFGLSAWGFTTLSRVKLPAEVMTTAPVASVVALEQQPRSVLPDAQAARPFPALPATIPEFPFPDDLVTGTTVAPEVVAPREVENFAGIQPEAIPQIPSLEGEVEAAVEPLVVTDATAAPALASAEVGEPPIPMPARPMAARPVESVPLSEVKTLYVVADMLNVRAVPSTTGPVLQKVAQGFAVAPRQQSDGWVGFLMQDGTTGWMRTDYLSDTLPQRREAPAASTGSQPLNLMM